MNSKTLSFMVAWVAASVMLVSSCGKREREPTLELGEFEPIVKRFEQVSLNVADPVEVKDLRIVFGPMDSPRQRAICDLTEDEPPTIIVLKAGWDAMNDAERESLLFHELGHCVLFRNHLTHVAPNGIPASLMNPYLISGYTYLSFQDYYLEELFDPQKRTNAQ